MLVAAAKQAGAHVLDLGIARDTESHVQACLEKALAAHVDILVTTGDIAAPRLARLLCGNDFVSRSSASMHCSGSIPLA